MLINKEIIKPDLVIDEGYSLKDFGLNARIINMTSFAKGTIGILTAEGELFCDNVFIKAGNLSTSKKTIEKFKKLLVDIIYSAKENPITIQS